MSTTALKHQPHDPAFADALGLHEDGLRELGGAIEREIRALLPVRQTGKIAEVVGTLIKVAGINLKLGELCELRTPQGKLHVPYDKIHTEFDLLAAA